MDIITLKSNSLSVIIGIYNSERRISQPVSLAIELEVDISNAAASGDISDTVDYARLFCEIRHILKFGEFRLIETAAMAICRYILSPTNRKLNGKSICAATVILEKTDIVCSTGSAGVRIRRQAELLDFNVEVKPFGEVEIIAESSDCGLYFLKISPKSSIPDHYHDIMTETEVCITDGLLLNGQQQAKGLARIWPKKFVHRYENPTSREQVILCIDRPRFIESDEIQDSPSLVAASTVSYWNIYNDIET